MGTKREQAEQLKRLAETTVVKNEDRPGNPWVTITLNAFELVGDGDQLRTTNATDLRRPLIEALVAHIPDALTEIAAAAHEEAQCCARAEFESLRARYPEALNEAAEVTE